MNITTVHGVDTETIERLIHTHTFIMNAILFYMREGNLTDKEMDLAKTNLYRGGEQLAILDDELKKRGVTHEQSANQ